ncbi:hypothetical protein HH310_28385 [Actinoplanes sp. TBRC 11911]|uniref:hypothetical protein n=1 Tax=Actinoplanes sp. TBRC 11911 TaxID=2729386 RepID=UPI00145D0593|nr:hypothetical protein [Actinoplanes sp. TBRC 11911]NMO55092.1 hypothetical protein [Actinoplanes sp. TBRC 11911]
MYRNVALPSATDLEDGVRDWVFSEPLRDLIVHFGGELPTTDARTALGWLDEFSYEHWDFRRGVERADIKQQVFENASLVLAATGALGLRGHNTPQRDFYDRILVLGGGARACFLRPDYTASLLRQGLTTDGIAGLGSERRLSPPEREIAGPGAETEADALFRGFDRAGVDARIVTATGPRSSTADVRRANTADTYDAWRAADPAPVSTILIVTSEIYVPFQHYDAVRKLDATVETVGLPAAYTLPDGLRQSFQPENYLQELRSALRSMRRLLETPGDNGDRR